MRRWQILRVTQLIIVIVFIVWTNWQKTNYEFFSDKPLEIDADDERESERPASNNTYISTQENIQEAEVTRQSSIKNTISIVNVPTHAVLHFGPHKTGTTSIQALSRAYKTQLDMDNYGMPWARVKGINKIERKDRPTDNQVHFATCFYHSSTIVTRKYQCMPELLTLGHNIAAESKNILLTSEIFDNLTNMTQLKHYLSAWDEVIVVGTYRRFYDWMISHISQENQYIGGYAQFRDNTTDTLQRSIKGYIMEQLNSDFDNLEYDSLYRYRDAFKKFTILNSHELRVSLMEQFYCTAMPNANQTCLIVKQQETQKNRAHPPSTYENIAYNAFRSGIISTKNNGITRRITKKEYYYLLERIRIHQEETLGRSSTDFIRTCLERSVLDILLEKSLSHERSLVPEFFKRPIGEKFLRYDFEKKSRNELCDVDVSAVVQSPEWHGFLKVLDSDIGRGI